MKTSTKLVTLLRSHGGAFSPLSVTGLKVWIDANIGLYQASNGTTPAGNGDPVGYATDQSGSGNHLIQATTSAKPTLRTILGPGGTKPALEFDGVDDYLAAVPFTLTQPVSVFLVVQQVSWTVFDNWMDGNLYTSMLINQVGGPPSFALYALLGNNNSNPNLAIGTYGIVTAVYSGASSISRVNAGTKITGNPGTAAPAGFTLGATSPTGAQSPANIRVSEVLVYNRDLSASGEDASVLTYLNTKWGVY